MRTYTADEPSEGFPPPPLPFLFPSTEELSVSGNPGDVERADMRIVQAAAQEVRGWEGEREERRRRERGRGK